MLKFVAIDLDDVCLDFTGGLRAAIMREYNVEITEDQITDFNLGPFLNPIIGRSWWKWMRERDWIWSGFPAVDGAIGGVDALRRNGWYVECLTSKPPWAEFAVWRWLGKWRIPFNRVTIVTQGDNKAAWSSATWLVDDKIENVVDWVEFSDRRRAILFHRSHNAKEKLPERAERASNWADVLRILNRE